MMKEYLRSTYFMDCDSLLIKDKAKELVRSTDHELDKAREVFYFVRDEIKYDPYLYSSDAEDFIASKILNRGEGYCVQKAVLLSTLARAVGIPSRLGFATIRNHLAPKELVKFLGTNLLVHGYSELFIEGRWIKATPTFDLKMCQKIDVPVVEFDGRKDAILPKYNNKGEPYIEYIKYHGSYSDLPLDRILKIEMETYGK
ncbi:MAG: transglutaminase domain-containing protein [Candidatus Methanoliparum thermophilum]|uniref:Transglutaminase domain-containing protein n=1 Tax=Methanoliparum thermophilum TaxID=2491083 RepID=A0A520KSV1_METT2|nr:transglutaminase-like domain-containing protein [Candidatus Methanoliparum sp. LAM-1]RZN64488.1 MAG: transglutaminase domain-containing protein [Candidatus Methanoliparum thermophilum]